MSGTTGELDGDAEEVTAAPPQLSVIIPVYNRVATLRTAIASVLAQDGVAVEVIVVDDGSDDSSAAAATEVDKRVRVIRQQRAGVSAARNAGVAASTAPLIGFLDSDDEVSGGWASALVAAMGTPDVGMASCSVRRRYPDGTETVARPEALGPAFAGITACFLAGAYVLRRCVFDEAGGFRDDLRFGENTELALRVCWCLAGDGFAAAIVPVPLAVWNIGAARAHEPLSVLAAAERMLGDHGDALARDRGLRASQHGVAGVNAVRVGDMRRARRHLFAAARDRPALRTLARAGAAMVPPVARRAWPGLGPLAAPLPSPAQARPLALLPTATVVIACYNGGADLLEQVRAVGLQLEEGQSELILADNGSNDGSVEAALAQGFPGVRSIPATQRRGQSHARNAGAQAGTGQVVLFLDQDDHARPGYLDSMRRALVEHDFVASRLCIDQLNDPVTMRSRRPAQVTGLGGGLYPWGYGSTLGIDRALFEAVGGFDEDLVNGEDVDLCYRVQERFAVSLELAQDAVLDYRLRSGWRRILRQGRLYGRSGPDIYIRHRMHGMRADPLRRVVRLWLGLVRQCLSRDQGRRWEAVFVLGARLGRLEGAVRRGVWYP